MQIFNKENLNEARNIPDGEEFIFEFVDCGICYQDVCINYNGEMYYETDSCYQDAKTGKELKCFYSYDKDNNYRIVVKNLDGTMELH